MMIPDNFLLMITIYGGFQITSFNDYHPMMISDNFLLMITIFGGFQITADVVMLYSYVD